MDHKYDEIVTGIENGKKESDEVIMKENDKRDEVVMEKERGVERDEIVLAWRNEMVMAWRDKVVVAQRDKMIAAESNEENENESHKENDESDEMDMVMESSQNQAKGNVMGCLHQHGAVFAPETQSQGELSEGGISYLPAHLLQ